MGDAKRIEEAKQKLHDRRVGFVREHSGVFLQAEVFHRGLNTTRIHFSNGNPVDWAVKLANDLFEALEEFARKDEK